MNRGVRRQDRTGEAFRPIQQLGVAGVLCCVMLGWECWAARGHSSTAWPTARCPEFYEVRSTEYCWGPARPPVAPSLGRRLELSRDVSIRSRGSVMPSRARPWHRGWAEGKRPRHWIARHKRGQGFSRSGVVPNPAVRREGGLDGLEFRPLVSVCRAAGGYPVEGSTSHIWQTTWQARVECRVRDVTAATATSGREGKRKAGVGDGVHVVRHKPLRSRGCGLLTAWAGHLKVSS